MTRGCFIWIESLSMSLTLLSKRIQVASLFHRTVLWYWRVQRGSKEHTYFPHFHTNWITVFWFVLVTQHSRTWTWKVEREICGKRGMREERDGDEKITKGRKEKKGWTNEPVDSSVPSRFVCTCSSFLEPFLPFDSLTNLPSSFL